MSSIKQCKVKGWKPKRWFCMLKFKKKRGKEVKLSMIKITFLGLWFLDHPALYKASSANYLKGDWLGTQKESCYILEKWNEITGPFIMLQRKHSISKTKTKRSMKLKIMPADHLMSSVEDSKRGSESSVVSDIFLEICTWSDKAEVTERRSNGVDRFYQEESRKQQYHWQDL